MECPTRNDLVLSYLRSQAEQAAAEAAIRTVSDPTAHELLEAARAAMLASRKALLEHCEQHGC